MRRGITFTSASPVWVAHMATKSYLSGSCERFASAAVCSDRWHAPSQVAGRTWQAAGWAARAPQQQTHSATCWAGACWTAERAAHLQTLRMSVTGCCPSSDVAPAAMTCPHSCSC